ncbi:hypothetical protein GX645_03480 [Candidatus Sumerlaeota bacterium]|nr:hypothetical protein [Candidatus Sumerlaeota bacterium]
MIQSKSSDPAMPLEDVTKEPLSIWVRVWEAAKQGDSSGVEDSWTDLTQTPPRIVSWYFQVFRWLKNRAKQDDEKTTDLIVLLANELQVKKDFAFMYEIIKFAVQTWPKCGKFGPLAGRALKGLYGANPWFRSVASSLNGAKLSVVFDRFDEYIKLTPGQVWRHYQFGDGIITDFDMNTRRIVIEFDDAENGNKMKKEFSFDGANSFLKYFAPDHIVARRMTDLPELQKIAEEAPQKLVRMILKGHNGTINQSDLKDFVSGTIVAAKSWNRWWEKARLEIQKDPMIEFDTTGGARATLVLRSTPRSLTDEIREVFFNSNCSTMVDALLDMLDRLSKGDEVEDELPLEMQKHIEALATKPETSLIDKLQIAFMHEDLAQIGAKGTLPEACSTAAIIAKIDDYALLADISSYDYSVRALNMLYARDGEEGHELACALLPYASPKVAQAIWRELTKDKNEECAVDAIQQLLASPIDNPDTYLWAVHCILSGSWKALADAIPASRLIIELVNLLGDWVVMADKESVNRRTREEAKKLIARVRTMLQIRGKVLDRQLDFMPIRLATLELPSEQLAQLRSAIAACPAFNNVFCVGAEKAIQKSLEMLAHDAGEAEPMPEASPVDAGEGWHWCTKQGREKMSERLAYLQNEALPKNAEEIAKARAEGDLKENAGYHAARERHGMLLDEINILSMGLSSCKIFNPEDVDTTTVSFGVRFTARNLSTDAIESYIVLGSFESDLEQHIISYETPFMTPFLGAHKGDVVTATSVDGTQSSDYRIEEIAAAI